MRWNIAVSLTAAAFHAATFVVASNKKVPEYRAYLLFTGFFMIMELFQASQWWIGDVTVGCTEFNRTMTMMAYLLIWFQPYLFAVIGDRSRLHSVQVRLQYAKKVAHMTLWYAMINLFAGMSTRPSYQLPRSNFGLETCTTVGPHGHLAWSFAPLTIVYGPTHFVYVILILATISFYPRPLLFTIGVGWIATLFVSTYLVGAGAELPAFWFLLSVFVDIPILARVLLYRA
uniref:Uncharacterized protein n=1 Tax=viral metagenome TaxID=1070528 RepID=A0A6C0IYL3_9ZZZZ